MDLLDLMDAIKGHAATAAVTAGGATFTDVAVGFPPAKGRCIRVFYGGEREPERFEDDETLNSTLVAQAIHVRGWWPTASTGTSEQRVIEGQMAAFVKALRTALLADQDLGGKAQDGLKVGHAVCDQVNLGGRVGVVGTQYSVVDIEITVDYDEFPQSR